MYKGKIELFDAIGFLVYYVAYVLVVVLWLQTQLQILMLLLVIIVWL